jgi:3-oxoacyl-[acyl-carrier protein] reductase
VVAEVKAGGVQAVAVQADVGVVADVARLFDEAIGHFGKIDILVNNAGIILYKPLADVNEEEFDRLFAVNVKGTFFCCQQAAKKMADGGRIVNFSSSTTALMLPTYSAYVATKGAVEQLSHVLAKELGPRGITVNVVSPGPTDTELFGQGKSEEDKRRFAQLAALGRLGTPEDIADVVAFLASDEARWVSGQNLRANGGVI